MCHPPSFRKTIGASGHDIYIKKKYSFKDLILWTRLESSYFFIGACAVAALHEFAGLQWLRLPWTPVALIGTAIAFLIGFQNNAAYGRAWEARKIWGGILNESRAFGTMIRDMITNDHAAEPVSDSELKTIHQRVVHRHLAWLTASRFAMRPKRPWETFTEHRTNREYYDKIYIPERDGSMEDEVAALLEEDEFKQVMQKSNKASAIMSRQSAQLRVLKEKGLIWELAFLELEHVIREFFSLQGKSERIKNFPYPRQYATLSYGIVRVFVLLLPFGVIPEFSEIGEALRGEYPLVGQYFVWLGVPFTVIVSWVFNTMQRIGVVGENPFEGSANYVPISTMARTVEIEMREMLDEPQDQIPEPYGPVDGVQV